VSHNIHPLYELALCCVFVKQSPGPFHCGSNCLEHPFSRSYGVNLPSSLTTAHSRALVYSTRLPVSVYGTVTADIHTAFLGSVLGLIKIAINLIKFHFCVPVIKSFGGSGIFIICLIPIDYAFRPRLRGRLTLS
jgi:hypothetical protein